MVKLPEATTLATEEPEMVPNRMPDTTVTLAGPPRSRPTSARAKSLKYSPAPELCRKVANTTNMMM